MKLTANFITAPACPGAVCPVFRKQFSAAAVKKAILRISALGLYEATLNGTRIGEFVLAPGWTQYDRRLQVQTYDITGLLKPENTLCVTVGKGWFAGNIGWLGKSGHWGKVPALIAQLRLTDSDGAETVIDTDTTWDVSEGPVRMSEIYHGEEYDARIIPDFSKKANLLNHPKSILIEQEGEEIREQESLADFEVIQTPAGETVLDFKQNAVGYVVVEGTLPEGAVLEYDHAEVLDKDGNFYTDNLRSAKQKVCYISAGGPFAYKPHFTFQGFRYIRLLQGAEHLKNLKLRVAVVYSALKRTGYFECSDPLVNRLYENAIWGQRGNFVDVPTDCPQRDERLGWTADAQVFIGTAALNYNVHKFFKKWLQDLACAQFSNGNMPDFCPSYYGDQSALEGDGKPATGWGDAAVICPWKIYLAYGDKALLAEQFESMRGWVDFMRSQDDGSGTWSSGDKFCDWLAMDCAPGDYIGVTDTTLICTAFYAYSTGLLCKAGRVLGRDMSAYEQLYKKIKTAFNDKFVTGPGRLRGDTQTAYAQALYFDLVDDKPAFAKRLCELIEENGNRLTTGFLGTPYLLPALSENGCHELAYTLLLQQDFPSWLYSVNMGATTIWEHWDGIRPDGTMWSRNMNSFNHYAYGSVAEWMYGVMGGIKIDETRPAYAHILIEPVPDQRIDWVKVSYDTGHGLVRSEWARQSDGTVRYDITVPEGSTAAVTLAGKTILVDAGKYQYQV